MISLAGLDFLGAVFAKEWAASRSHWLFVAGLLTFAVLFGVYAISLEVAELSTVTFGWIILLQVGLLLFGVFATGWRSRPANGRRSPSSSGCRPSSPAPNGAARLSSRLDQTEAMGGGRGLAPARDLELPQDAPDVDANGLLADVEVPGDLAIAPPGGHQVENIPLPGR